MIQKTASDIDVRRDELPAAGELQPIALRSMFWRPDYLAPSPWLEHVPFAFWLVEAHAPRIVVELGGNDGVAYFAFCQAVDRLGLDARCFSVGVDAATPGDDEALAKMRAHNDARYSAFSRLWRGAGETGLNHVADGEVDLLHLDGALSFESASVLLKRWTPKLSPRAVVLIHGSNRREAGNGVYQLVAELAASHPLFEFAQGDGLVVVGFGPEQGELLQRLFAAGADDRARKSLREVFFRLGRACADGFQALVQHERSRELVAEIENQQRQIEEIQAVLERTRHDLESRSGDLTEARIRLQAQLDQHVLERGQLIQQLNLLQGIREDLRADNARLEERIEAAHAEARQRAAEIRMLSEQSNDHRLRLAETAGSIEARERELATLRAGIDDRERALAEATAALDAARADLERARRQVDERDAALAAERAQREAEAEAIAAHKARQQAMEAELANLSEAQKAALDKDAVLLRLRAEAEKRSTEAIKALREEKAALEADVAALLEGANAEKARHAAREADFARDQAALARDLEQARSRLAQQEAQLQAEIAGAAADKARHATSMEALEAQLQAAIEASAADKARHATSMEALEAQLQAAIEASAADKARHATEIAAYESRLQATTETSATALAQARAELDERDAQLQALGATAAADAARLAEANARIAEQEAQLQAQIATAAGDKAQLAAQAQAGEALAAQLAEREARLQALDAAATEALARQADAQARLAEQEAQLQALIASAAADKAQLAVQTQAGEALAAELAEARAQLEDREARVQALEAAVADADARHGEARARLAEHETQLAALIEDAAACKAREDELVRSLEQAGQRATEQDAELASLREALADGERRAAEAARSGNAMLHKLAAAVKALREDKLALEAERGTLAQSLATLQQDQAGGEAERARMAQSLAALQQAKADLDAQFVTLRLAAAESERRAHRDGEAAAEQARSLQAQVDQLRQAAADAARRHDAELAALRQAVAGAADARARLEQDMASRIQEVATLSSLLLDSERKAHDSQQALATATRRQEAEILALTAALDAERQALAGIRGSASWKLARPLRAAGRLFRKPASPDAPVEADAGGDSLASDVVLLKFSPLFDAAWYRQAHPDVPGDLDGAAEHYLRHGAALGFDPGPGFSTRAYLGRYKDVAAAGMNPLVHYLRHGQAEGRSPK
jgi:chromosome segregation ATPase